MRAEDLGWRSSPPESPAAVPTGLVRDIRELLIMDRLFEAAPTFG